ncbi:MAG: hypothetical protein GXP54_09400 [Deltaproteobacteria bacterium]|nr:hypothetical protein [Deltaproteobacteria bacterium]
MEVSSGQTTWIGCLVLFFMCAQACSAPDQGGADAVQDAKDTGLTEGLFAHDSEAELPDQGVPDNTNDSLEKPETSPGQAARIRFKVDDSKNRTYQDKQMVWTGSFKWSAADNTIVPASSWLPSDGPYPPLYDDGPTSQGGHEPDGSVKGDHVFETEVFFKATETTTFEYGVLNEFDGWIWVGPNGQFEVPKGSSDTITAPGLTIPAFGTVDFKVTLDSAALDDSFMPFVPCDVDPGGSCIYLKSSANSWAPVQLLDNGEKGDDQGGDGVYTFVQSLNLGPHDGLLYTGQHAQFVFSFAMAETDPENGLEYKVKGNASKKGVKAYSDHGSPGVFHDEPVVMERDSRGKVFNTTVIIGGGKPWCDVDEDCFSDVVCLDGGCGETTVVSHKWTPVLDGDIGADWDESLLVATNTAVTDWGTGKDELTALYAAYDDTHLYFGIKGGCGADNAIVAYLDRDFGESTGPADMNTLSDDEGELDAAVSSKLVVAAPGFGADFAFGSKGMKSFTEGSDLGSAGQGSGWRDIGDPGDFAWIQGSVVTKTGGNGIEAAIPIATVFPDGIPAQGSNVALVVRLVNADGQYTSNQTLPQDHDAANPWTMTKVAVFAVLPANQPESRRRP